MGERQKRPRDIGRGLRGIQPIITGFENGGRSPEPRNVDGPLEIGKARKGIYSTASRQDAPCEHFGFSPVRPVLDV